MARMQSFVALLRGINVGGHNKVPMAELRTLCRDLGWHEVESYIQSGNVLFRSEEIPANLELALEQSLAERFGLPVPVIVRSADDWRSYVGSNPWSDAAAAAPNLVMLSG